MNPTESDRDTAASGLTLHDALSLLRRRRWIVLTCVMLVPLSAVIFSLFQTAEYQGQAEVLLSQQNLASSLTGVPDTSVRPSDGDRIAQTQAKLATVPVIASRTLKALQINDRSATDLLDQIEVSTEQNSDILVFNATDPDRSLAGKIANEYAHQYTRYRAGIDTAAVHNALDEVTTRIEQLEKAGDRNTSLHGTLIDKQQQLRTLEALQTANSFVVRRENLAEKVKPTPKRNAMLGLVLGVLLGIGLAFARDALDTRLRNAEQVAAEIGLPLLARIPAPRHEHVGPVMLSDPHGPGAETYRVLRGNLEFAMLGRDIRTLMVTSSVQVEGKSTVISNLALALARGGHSVALVDLDLRRPSIERLFDINTGAGVTNVAIGRVSLKKACVNVPLDAAPATAEQNGGGSLAWTGPSSRRLDRAATKDAEQGRLDVLPCGAIPPDPGEFVGTEALGEIIRELRESYDLVLIDAPPMLRVGDPLTLARHVDGVFVVARLGVVTSAMSHELARMLSVAPMATLGVVVTGTGEESAYAYAYAYADEDDSAWPAPDAASREATPSDATSREATSNSADQNGGSAEDEAVSEPSSRATENDD
ncbi:MAG: P-loop NTPase [Actinobacteria bacterium]|nr:P-loop NTPase [Actinomycetota bacterium]